MISQAKKNSHGTKHVAALQQQLPHQSLGCSSSVVRMSGIFMSMILLTSVSLSYVFGRFCQSHYLPSIQRALQEKSTTSLFLQIVSPDNTNKTVKDMLADTDGYDTEEDDDSVSTGADQLLVDVTHLDPAFLSSPIRLETALSTLLQDNLRDQTLSLRHTNHLERGGGISFTVLLSSSHVFLHAWPSTGTLTLDIYKSRASFATNNDEGNDDEEAGQEESLINLVYAIEELFASGKGVSDDKPPRFYWAIKERGMDYENDKSDPSDSADYRMHYMGRKSFTHKEQISVVETPFQTFEVYDIVDIRDEHQKTDRVLFLDHVVQSSRFGLEAYHEALVHPALMAHPNPKRVAIVGGGEGATLREVLKHSTVEKVVMIEIDAVMVNASKTALLEWNDCSDLVGSVGSCFDDPRADVYLEDAVGWFLKRYYGQDVAEEDKFDVIIMDALDPSSLVGFSDVLYGNLALTQSMRNAMTDQGILVAQVGPADVVFDAGKEFNAEVAATSKMRQLFREVGFVHSLQYSELHCGFLAPWAFLISFLDATETKTRWYSNAATIDLELSKRAIPTISGDFPFKYYDGATMAAYQYPSRPDQNVYCRSFPNSTGCPTAEYQTGHPVPGLSLTGTTLHNGTFSILGFQQAVHGLSIMPSTAKILSGLSDTATSRLSGIESAIASIGFGHDLFGSTGYMVNPIIARHRLASLYASVPFEAKNGTTMLDKCDIVDTAKVPLPLTLAMGDELHQMGNAFIARNLYSILTGVQH